MPTIKNETAWDGKAIRSILCRLARQFPFTSYSSKWEVRYSTTGGYTGRFDYKHSGPYSTIIGIPRQSVDPVQFAVAAQRLASNGRFGVRENAALLRKCDWASRFPITKRAPRPSDAPVAKQTRLVKTIKHPKSNHGLASRNSPSRS